MLLPSQVNSIIENSRVLILDGGLATELERQGHNLKHQLWSAKLLQLDPDAIRSVHESYLAAGAGCITTASYQASFEGFASAGISKSAARQLLADSVTIARQAVHGFMEENSPGTRAQPPLVAASIGPWGACLADGSEYRGDYEVSAKRLREFHAERLDVLCDAQPDLLAFETIPSFREAEVLRELIGERCQTSAWVSFSCRDGRHISDGTPIGECVRLFEDCDPILQPASTARHPDM